ncbi:MAG: putative O-glycosylation ligase, exosortase A system-associated [Burkholderiaceae bacterium]
MRDIVLALFLFAALPIAAFRPFVAIGIFTWLSLMNPHKLTWGFAAFMPWAQMYAIAAIFSITFIEPKLVFDSIKRYWLPLLYLAWMLVTTTFATSPDEAWFRLGEVAKVHLMCLLALAVLSDRNRVKWLLAIIIGSVIFYGVKGGIYTLTTGGGGRVWGPLKTAINDNNHLAAALVFMFPLLYWAYTEVKQRWQKLALLAALALVPISILGSQSRGAFVASIAVATMLFLRGKGKLQIAVLTIVLGVGAASVMPDEYWSRISTIKVYQEDASAQGRIHTWKIAARVANDRITGAGFEYYGNYLYRRHADDPNDVHSSHSIYFQSLGEHGWIGLTLFLMILASFWRKCGRLIRLGEDRQDDSLSKLARSLQIALVGYMVGGLFVNVGNWDGLYFVYIVVLGLSRLNDESEVHTSSPAVPRVQRRRFRKRKHA